LLEALAVSGCFAQEETSVGTLDTLTVRCLTHGTSPLTLVPAPDGMGLGTEVFDELARPFDMTLVNGSITCGEPTPTPSPTNTAAPTATNTPVPTHTPTATNTLVPTHTPT